MAKQGEILEYLAVNTTENSTTLWNYRQRECAFWTDYLPTVIGYITPTYPPTTEVRNLSNCVFIFLQRSSDNILAKSEYSLSDISYITGKSLSEAMIFASTNPQYGDRLFST